MVPNWSEINLASFRAFTAIRGPLFPKPVSILTGTFLPFLTTRPANWRAHKTQNCPLNFNSTTCANPASTQARPPPKPRRLPNVNFLPTDLEGMINNLSLVRFQLLPKIILKSWTHAKCFMFYTKSDRNLTLILEVLEKNEMTRHCDVTFTFLKLQMNLCNCIISLYFVDSET